MTTDQVLQAATRYHSNVPMEELTVAPWNARRVMDDDAIKALAETIRTEGLLQPLVIRKRVAQGDIIGQGFVEKWEVICGARRLMALKLLEADVVACWVVEASDQRAKLMNVTENVQRESLSPMDEAEAFGGLFEHEGMDAAMIAAEIGKDVTYVYRTMRLMSLIPKFKTALKEGTIVKGVALEAARLPIEQQTELAAMILRRGERADAFSVAYVKEWIGRHHMRPLKDAPWAMRDEMFGVEKVYGGACGECPKRTGAEALLFDELKKTDDRCLDASCWKKRTDQLIRITKAKFPGIELLKGNETWKWKESKAAGAIQGLIVEDGYLASGTVAGMLVKFEWEGNANGDAARSSKKAKAEAKAGRETVAIRMQVLAETIAAILLTGYRKDELPMMVKTFIGRMVNDDRRFLCKALKLEVEHGHHGGKDFESTLMKWVKGMKPEDDKGYLKVMVSLALACHVRQGVFESGDILMETAKGLHVGVKAIEERVRAGKKKTPPTVKVPDQKKVERMAKATKAAGVKTRTRRKTTTKKK